jgi:hypothetical protein
VASVAPDGTIVQPGQRQPPRLQPGHQPLQPGQVLPGQANQPGQIQQQKQLPRPAQNTSPALRDLFGGFGNTAPRQAAPPAQPRPPLNTTPRPPAAVGRSAAVPADNTTR